MIKINKRIGVLMLLSIAITEMLIAEPIEITGDNIPYIRSVFSSDGLSVEQLAKSYPQYIGAKDEFDRREVMATIKPEIEQKLATIKTAKSFSIQAVATLSEYDFETETFDYKFTYTAAYFGGGILRFFDKEKLKIFAYGLVTDRFRIGKTEARQLLAQLDAARQIGVTFVGSMGEDCALYATSIILSKPSGQVILTRMVGQPQVESSYSKKFLTNGIIDHGVFTYLSQPGRHVMYLPVLAANKKVKGWLSLIGEGENFLVSVSDAVEQINAGDEIGNLDNPGNWRLPEMSDTSGIFPRGGNRKENVGKTWKYYDLDQKPAIISATSKADIEIMIYRNQNYSEQTKPDFVLKAGKWGRMMKQKLDGPIVGYPSGVYLRASQEDSGEVIIYE